MRWPVILRYDGLVLLLNAVFLFISAAISAIAGDAALLPLVFSGLLVTLFGLFPLIFVPPTKEISNTEGLAIVVSGWLLSCLVGTIPYVLWGGEFSFTNAWFESVSGYTTTGSSILTNIEALPMGLLFWRNATHWIGGVGIVVFVLSVLPSMGVASMVLYRAEMSPYAIDNFRYRTKRAMQILLSVYVGLTFLETIFLLIFGMSAFDAVTTSFATIATGGFSPRNASIAYYHSLPIEIVIMIFMLLSGIHFGLLFSAISGRPKNLWKSPVVRYYLLAMGVGIAMATLDLHGRIYPDWGAALRYGAFQIISIGTSTGFATTNSAVWPPLSQLLLLFFMMQCAGAGSTSGGIKVDRIVIFGKAFARRIRQIRHPKAVIAVKMGERSLAEDVVTSSVLYIVTYVSVVFFSTLILTALGVDLVSAFSGSATTMGGVGPGLGTVGSTSNFAAIPALGKWTLTLTMLLGRLEIYGLIIFFIPATWRR